MDSKYDVFLCHAKEDSQLALSMAGFLENRKLHCWVSSRDVQAGKDYAGSIIGAIQGSRLMVVILSASANRSNHVRIEVERGFNHDLALLPFRTDNVKPEQSLEYFLSAYQWLDAASGKPEDHFENLYKHCADLLQTEKTDAPAIIVKDENPAAPGPAPLPAEKTIVPPPVEPPVAKPAEVPPVQPPVAPPVQSKPPVAQPQPPPSPKPVLPPAPPPPVYPFQQKKGSDKPLAGVILGGLGAFILLFFIYHWLFQKHTITFRNNTLTAVYIELDGQMDTIPAGGTFDYKAKNNYRLKTQAAAYLLSTKAGLLGQKMEWDIDTVVHAWGNFEYPLYIGPKYFLLRVVNTSSSNIYYVTVSAGDFNYKYEYNISIPNDGKTYDMGYYRALAGMKVDVLNLDKKELIWTEGNNLTFANQENQYVSLPFR